MTNRKAKFNALYKIRINKNMHSTRRKFLKTGALAGIGIPLAGSTANRKINGSPQERYKKLDTALEQPVLKRRLFPNPIIIQSCDLLHYNGNYMIRVRSTDGAEGFCVGHNIRMPHLYPIQLQLVNPFFIGKDARDLDQLVDDVTMFKNNYKYQGYTLWIPVATVEIAILDMLGRIAKKSIGELIGDIHNTEIAVYQANNNRGKTAEESIE
ncbi:MAG TPA: hypothetical protein VKA10_02375, partial [Prolixibacteraceae bacterium]|nr:hypothetical protein [Prolixibacteraceae bacterium]